MGWGGQRETVCEGWVTRAAQGARAGKASLGKNLRYALETSSRPVG